LNYFRYQEYLEVYGLSRKLFAGYVLVSLGMLLAAAGGSWDITNHLLNKPETFFAPPHAVLYSGVASAVVGTVLVFSASRSGDGATGKMIWPVKLVIAGVVMLISAAPVDFGWHSAFGLDGLLSPPHFVLVSGMIVGSAGALAGLAQSAKRLPSVLIVIAILPIWLGASGMIDMFSLPFSESEYFNFNPHPTLGVAVATLSFPFLYDWWCFYYNRRIDLNYSKQRTYPHYPILHIKHHPDSGCRRAACIFQIKVFTVRCRYNRQPCVLYAVLSIDNLHLQ
jgi:hypothetical protein